MRNDLQALVDEVAAVLGAPATLEDRDFGLLAFCAHGSSDGAAGDDLTALDAVRTRSILSRGSAPAIRRWFEEFGIAGATGPLRTPADPDTGVLTRLLLPVRHEGRPVGYLWLLDGGRTDPAARDDPALAAALALTAEIARLLAHRSADDDLGGILAGALAGSPVARDRAVRALASRLGEQTPLALVALRVPGAEDRRLPPAGAAVSGDGRLALAVTLSRPDDLRPAGDRAATALAGLPRDSSAGISAVHRGPWRLAEQEAQARAAARVASAVPVFSPVARWDELGGWRLAAALPAPDPAVLPLLADRVLAETATAYLDAAGSVARTAEALHLHRQTLYYRLGRITALTGLDLADGDTRLLVHASLRRAALP